MNQAIAENLAFLTTTASAPPPVSATFSLAPQFSSAALVLNTQDEIISELEQRLRTIAQQLEAIGLDVQMATVTYSPEEVVADAKIPKCLLDCQQVASRLDRLGKQLELLRSDIEDKHKTQFHDQMVAEEVYGKLDDLRRNQQELRLSLQELLSQFNHPVAPALATQLLNLESHRQTLLSEFNSAQCELEEITNSQRENFRGEQDQRYAELASELRSYYQSQLATLGSRFLNNSDSSQAESQRLLLEAKSSLAQLASLSKEISSQTDQFIQLGEKLAAALRNKITASLSRTTVSQVEADLVSLRQLKQQLQELSRFNLENADSIASLGAQLRKVNALMATIWTATSDPMSRWCESLRRLNSTRLPESASQWLKHTVEVLMPQCQACASTVRGELCEIEKQNLALDQLRHRLASDLLGSDQRRTQAETARFSLNAKYEADHHQLAIECRKASDGRLAKLEQEFRECKAKNRALLEPRLEELQKHFSSLRYRIGDTLSLTPAKEVGSKFLTDFTQLQAVDDRVLGVEAELAQLRRAQQRETQLRRKLTEVRDLYARTQDVVSTIRPKPLASSSSAGEAFVFTLTAEIYGVQQVDQDLIEDSATVELKVGPQRRAVVVPIGEDTDVPVASLTFPKVTTASPLVVDIRAGGKPSGHYEMPLENVEHNEWIDFQLPESSLSHVKGNELEPIITFRLSK